MSTIVNILVPEITPDIREIIDEFQGIRSKFVKIWIPRSVLEQDRQYRSSFREPLENNLNPDNSISCFEWNVDNAEVTPIDRLYNYWIERFDDNQIGIILSNEVSPKDRKSMFLDARHKSELPDRWYHYKCFSDRDGIMAFCESVGAIVFALCEGTKFTKANGFGPKVYKEKETGYLWYLDMLHGNHYEVFDSTGKIHIGEADVSTGRIDRSKAVRGRRI